MWLAYHAEAQRTGARLVHSCGFDSIPYDLGVLYTVGQMPDGVPLKVQGFVRTNGRISGGTFHSTVEILSHVRQAASVARERRKLEGDPVGRAVHGVSGRPHNVPSAGGWVVPLPTIDPQHVLRSARALDRYGPDFTYEHYLVVKRLPMVGVLAVGAGLGVALTQLGPTRNLLLKLKDPGEGPTPEQRAKAWFNVRFEAQGGGKQLATEVSGGDPGYGETSKMLAESALCLARDELPRARRPADARGCDGPGADRPPRRRPRSSSRSSGASVGGLGPSRRSTSPIRSSVATPATVPCTPRAFSAPASSPRPPRPPA